MLFTFSYDIEKDISNYLITSKSVNNPNPTKAQERYIEKYGSVFEEGKLREFILDQIREYKLDVDLEPERMKQGWEPVREAFVKRSLEMFHLPDSDQVIRVFLTTDQRCSYNIDGRYFFISITRSASNQNKTIMHEMLHFLTWDVFGHRVESGEISKGAYNAVKESLTALLNVEFGDLLDGVLDNGYPQHQKIREVIVKAWQKTKDIQKTFEAGLEEVRKD